jgi:hypothetical protein
MITYRLKATDFNPLYNEGAQWQVIYKLDNLDYCRETYPIATDILKLQDIIIKECTRHKLTGADIQVF